MIETHAGLVTQKEAAEDILQTTRKFVREMPTLFDVFANPDRN